MPARGEIANEGEVEIAELGQAEAAGNGGRRHHQCVGQSALFAEPGPLPDAKPVLLVDDHQPQFRELDPLLDEGLGADDELGRPVGDLCERLPPLGGGEGAGQQLPLDPAVGEIALDRLGMLAGEDFGGGHEGGLVPSRDGLQQGIQGDHCFARSHIGLQQAVHRPPRGEIFRDLGDGAILPRGEREGEQPADAGIDLRSPRQHRGLGLGLEGPAAEGDPQLKLEQVLMHQAVPALLVLLGGLRQVHPPQRGGEGGKLPAIAPGFGEWVGDQAGVLLDHLPDQPAEVVHPQSLGEVVAGEHPAVGLRVIGVEPLHAGTAKLPAAGPSLGLPRDQDKVVVAELLQHPGLVEPECPDVKAVVFDGDPGDRTAVLGRSAVDINDPSPDLGVFVGDEGRHGGDVRQIEDVAGEHEQQVGDGLDRQPGEQFGPLRADSLDELDRLIEGGIVHGGGTRGRGGNADGWE